MKELQNENKIEHITESAVTQRGDCAFSVERGDLLAKTKIKVIRCYDGNRTAKDILNEAIALKVRKKLNDDIENIRRKEYNSDSTQDKKQP